MVNRVRKISRLYAETMNRPDHHAREAAKTAREKEQMARAMKRHTPHGLKVVSKNDGKVQAVQPRKNGKSVLQGTEPKGGWLDRLFRRRGR